MCVTARANTASRVSAEEGEGELALLASGEVGTLRSMDICARTRVADVVMRCAIFSVRTRAPATGGYKRFVTLFARIDERVIVNKRKAEKEADALGMGGQNFLFPGEYKTLSNDSYICERGISTVSLRPLHNSQISHAPIFFFTH